MDYENEDYPEGYTDLVKGILELDVPADNQTGRCKYSLLEGGVYPLLQSGSESLAVILGALEQAKIINLSLI
jgi:hypothetical protein